MFYDQDSTEQRLAHARLVAESLVPDMGLWRDEMTEWAGGESRMAVWLACLDYTDE